MDCYQRKVLEKLVPSIRLRYAEFEKTLAAKLRYGEKVRVCFLVCDASMFSGESVYQRLATDVRFACTIAVAPRVTRGESFLRETLYKTVNTLTARYGASVRALYDPETKHRMPIEADIVFSTIIYEDQTFAEYTAERLSAYALVAILYYGYGGLVITNESKTPFLPNIVLAWRYFVSNAATRQMNIDRNPLLAENVRAVGYAKMDRLFGIARKETGRKTVLICPHHTLERSPEALALSTFLVYADLFARLPTLFPDVRFVFRPHPLLFPRLATARWWGAEKTAAYKAKLEAFPNVEFQQGGDYFETFAQSDALVHDCGSFLAEYFYTGKPQCYLFDGETASVERQFLPIARKMLEHCHKARSEEEIIAFIRGIAGGEEDGEAAERARFAREEVCVNYPNATGRVIKEVLDSIERENES